mmetsp:Transcript_21917/g.19463  ORF Transcript_21917/g.19463 Transcript_21917/m.19463 type:complete len:99 (+) Transcript_21917:478-774(+)
MSYGATKGAINGMTLPMARDLGRYGIRVLNIAPSLFSTAMIDGIPDKFKKVYEKTVPIGRLGQTDEFAQLAKTCIENGYLNGVSLMLTGGAVAPYDDN